jgi:hypothetical protein
MPDSPAAAKLTDHPAFFFPNSGLPTWIWIQGKGYRGKPKIYRIIAENSGSVKILRKGKSPGRERKRHEAWGGTDQVACGNELTSSLQSGKKEEGEWVLRARGLDSSLKTSPWQFFQLTENQLPDTPGGGLG